MNVCVYGSASEKLAPVYYDAAAQLGRLIAEAGFGLVFGGGRFGLMGAVSLAAREAGGVTIGVAPRFFEQHGVLDPNCDQFYFTDNMRERKQKMEELSNAFIVTPGGIGTFDEFFEILTLRQLRQHKKPVLVLDTNGYYTCLRQMLAHSESEGFISASSTRMSLTSEGGSSASLVDFFTQPETLVERLKLLLVR